MRQRLAFSIVLEDVTSLVPLEDCDVSRSFNAFTTEVIIPIQIVEGGIIGEAALLNLTEAFKESYNKANALNPDTCDPFLRRVDAVKAVQTDIEEVRRRNLLGDEPEDMERFLQAATRDLMETVLFHLTVTASCNKCPVDSLLFDDFLIDYTVSSTLRDDPYDERRLVEGDAVASNTTLSLYSDRVLEATACLCPLERKQDRGPNLDDFTENLQMALEGIAPFDSVGLLKEVDQIDCQESAPVSEFDTVTILELNINDACNLDQGQLQTIADSFVAFYNQEISESYCDEYFRSLTSAEIVRVGGLTLRGTVSFEIKLTGLCRGCDPVKTDIFDMSIQKEGKSPSANSRRALTKVIDHSFTERRLQEVEQCFCKAGAAARAPTEAEFIQSFADILGARSDLPCVGSLATCSFLTNFQAEMIVSFEGDPRQLDNDQKKAQLEAAFSDSFNSFFEVSEDSCNPEFREITNVTAVIGVSLNEESAGLFNGRRLQLFDSFFSNATNSTEDLDDLGNTTIMSEAPTQAPTRGFGIGVFDALLFVSGTWYVL